MVMSTGTIRPSFAWACVAALNSLQNPMMLTPCWPSAGPTGGEGFAFPAGSCSLTIPVTFFAMALRYLSWLPAVGRGPAASHNSRKLSTHLRHTASRSCPHVFLRLLHLHEVQFHRRRPPEDRDQHPHAALVGVHFLDGAVEVGER